MKTGNDEVCGTCQHCKRDKSLDDFYCGCNASDYHGEFVRYNHYCDEWEKRKTVDDMKSLYKQIRNRSHG